MFKFNKQDIRKYGIYVSCPDVFVFNVLAGVVISRTVDTCYSQTFEHWFRGLTRLFILYSRASAEKSAFTASQKIYSQVPFTMSANYTQ